MMYWTAERAKFPKTARFIRSRMATSSVVNRFSS
jgi:hypothetical protein